MSNAADKKAILKNLVEQGKAKGMLSQKEIMDAYEETDITTEQYEKVVETLEALHIEIVDKFFDEILDESELLDEESTAILKSDNLEKALSQEGIAVDDPVKIYLKEIGRVPLISNDEEQELARRKSESQQKTNGQAKTRRQKKRERRDGDHQKSPVPVPVARKTGCR